MIDVIVKCSSCGGPVFIEDNPCSGCQEQQKRIAINAARLNRRTELNLA